MNWSVYVAGKQPGSFSREACNHSRNRKTRTADAHQSNSRLLLPLGLRGVWPLGVRLVAANSTSDLQVDLSTSAPGAIAVHGRLSSLCARAQCNVRDGACAGACRARVFRTSSRFHLWKHARIHSYRSSGHGTWPIDLGGHNRMLMQLAMVRGGQPWPSSMQPHIFTQFRASADSQTMLPQPPRRSPAINFAYIPT